MRRQVFATAASLLILAAAAWGQDANKPQEREYPFPLAPVKAALQNLGAYSGGRLPSLEGFIKLEGVHLEEYQRPFYEYKLELVPASANKTLVRVRAHVTAWQGALEANDSGYRTLESNGRLEADLLDRLNDYLVDKPADPALLTKRIEEVRAQREDAERQLAGLEEQLRNLQTSPEPTARPEFAVVNRPRIPVLDGPTSNAKVLLQAQRDDEFQIVERRGEWLRVSLDGAESGWIKRSLVDPASVTLPTLSSELPRTARIASTTAVSIDSFTILREMPTDFSGDWEPLKGKTALYVWARPQGSSLNETGNKLEFAESIFRDRYRQVAHSSQSTLAGIVIIFLDHQGGVAAASMEDIALWDSGTLSSQAFLKKCSLDPPSSFIKAPAAQAPQNRTR